MAGFQTPQRGGEFPYRKSANTRISSDLNGTATLQPKPLRTTSGSIPLIVRGFQKLLPLADARISKQADPPAVSFLPNARLTTENRAPGTIGEADRHFVFLSFSAKPSGQPLGSGKTACHRCRVRTAPSRCFRGIHFGSSLGQARYLGAH
jgi:hypothetical protein